MSTHYIIYSQNWYKPRMYTKTRGTVQRGGAKIDFRSLQFNFVKIQLEN